MTAELLRVSKIVKISLPQFHSNVRKFFSLATDKMLSRSFHCTQIFINPIDSFLTVTDSHYLGSCKVPGTLQQKTQLPHSFQIKDVSTRTQKYLFSAERLKPLHMTYRPFFFLFSSQPSISSYLNYLKKVRLNYMKEKILMILKDYIKVNLIQPTRLHTKGNHTGNGKRIFKLGGYFHIQIKDFSILHNIFKFKKA